MAVSTGTKRLTPFQLSLAKTCGKVGTKFPDIVEIKNEEDLRQAVRFDHVCALLREGYRDEGHFISVMCLYSDLDNDDTRSEESMAYWDDESNQMTIEKFRQEFKNYEFIIITSRNHGLDKKKTIKIDGVEKAEVRPARDKFHVIFPLGRVIDNVDELKSLLRRLTEAFPFFDPAVKDAARFFFGNPGAEIYWNPGRSIEEKLNQIEAEKKELDEVKVKEKYSPVSEINGTARKEDYEWIDREVVPRQNAYEIYKDVADLSNGSGQQLKGRCPFHPDSNPSFSIDGKTLTWICHSGCGKGNVIEYISRIKNISKGEAIDQLCETAGVENKFKTATINVPLVPVKKILPDAPVTEKILIPSGYVLSMKNGLEKIVSRKKSDGDSEEWNETVAPAPILITARLENVDTGAENLRLVWFRDGRWKSLVTSRKVVATTRLITDLSELGFPVTSNTAGALVKYIELFEALNIENLPKCRMSVNLGWQKGMAGFLFGSTYITADAAQITEVNPDTVEPEHWNKDWISFHPADAGELQTADAYYTNGSFSEWVELANSLYPYPRVISAMYFSLTAPFLDIIEAPNFTVDWSNETSTGKTTTLRFAGSCWGNPDERSSNSVLSTWDATPVWIERTASLLNGMPIMLDDTKLAGTGKNRDSAAIKISRTLYDIHSGRGRGRGSVSGTRETGSWKTILLTSGEQPAVDFTQDGGTRARVISLWGPVFGETTPGSAALVKKINSTVSKNFGHAGPRVIRFILSNRKQWDLWRRAYREYQEYFSKQAGANAAASRVGDYLAALAIVIPLVHAALPELRRDLPAADLVQHLWNSTAGSAAESDRATDALRSLLTFAASNQESFYGRQPKDHYGNKNQPVTGWLGAWKSADDWEYIAFTTKTVRKVLEDEGFEFKAITKTWNDRQWLETGGKDIGKNVRIQGENAFCYCVKRKALEDLGLVSKADSDEDNCYGLRVLSFNKLGCL